MKTRKKYLFIPLGFMLFILLNSSAQKEKGREEPKIEYNLPVNMREYDKKNLLALLESGKILYKANCSGCHGIFTKGLDSIPNWTQIQFDNYLAGFARKDPQSHAVALNMETSDLNLVLSFLKYYKKPPTDSTRFGNKD